MKNNSPKRLEILLWLAIRQFAKNGIDANEESESNETAAPDESPGKIGEKDISVLFGQLNKNETDKLKNLLADYNDKNAAEQENWKKHLRAFVGTDGRFLDENLHWSHIEEVLKKEPPAIQRIIFNSLPETDKNQLKPLLQIEKELITDNRQKDKFLLVSNAVQKSFAGQFTSLQDLPKPTAFDRLNGTQIVRLIRLAGIREVTYACARIEAVETIAAFLKRFPAEAARAIAAQLNSLPKTSEERLLFAENLVQNALETEPQPSAMLDLLGIRLIGIRMSESPAKRVSYAQQKLPREFAPELSEIIKTQGKKTPPDLQKEISAEIEQLAETIIKTSRNDSKPSKNQEKNDL